jgi:hypothetical protein
MAAALSCVAVAPALLERHACTRLAQRLARCPDGANDCGGVEAIELDAHGLRLQHAWLQRRGWAVGGDSIRIRPDWSGVHIDVEAPWVRPVPPTATRQPEPRRSPPEPSETNGGRTRSLPDLQVTIAARGAVVLPDTPLGTIAARDPVLRWRPGGPLRLQAEGSLEHAWGRMDTVGPMRAQLSSDAGERRVVLDGALSLGGGSPTAVVAALQGEDVWVELDDGAGGRLELTARERGARVALSARAFALGRLGTWGAAALPRAGLDLANATLDGSLELERTSGGFRTHIHEMTAVGLRVEHSSLSRVPIDFDALTVVGDLSWQPGQQQAQLTVVHRGAQLHMGGTRTTQGLELAVELPRTPCQAFFDAIPEGLTGLVDSTRWAGDLDGRLSFSLDFGALANAQTDPDSVAFTAPGSIELAFAPFEQCTVVADAPKIDLQALRGPYRHRFFDDTGRSHERVMAPGAPGYAALSSIPLVAQAFSALEDTRFWKHDGFDREQLEKALWYNLAVGRVARGASTITQQTARCLWLGIDRALARKLQESLLATRLEHALDKKRILELYLNVIELGPGVHGVAEAAAYYFGKSAHELDVLEALHVASMAPAPRRLASRFATGEVDETWMANLHRHVRRMHVQGHITKDELLQALRTPLRLRVHAG